MIAEGILTTRATISLAHNHQIEMPITEQMFLLLYEGKDPMQAVVDLMSRRSKHELD